VQKAVGKLCRLSDSAFWNKALAASVPHVVPPLWATPFHQFFKVNPRLQNGVHMTIEGFRVSVAASAVVFTNRQIGNAADFRPRKYAPDDIAHALRVTFEDRERLELWQVGCCDVSPSQRKALMKERK
jgi:hypothetical protein